MTVGTPIFVGNGFQVSLWMLKSADDSQHYTYIKQTKRYFHMYYQNPALESARDHAMYSTRIHSLWLPLVASSGKYTWKIVYSIREQVSETVDPDPVDSGVLLETRVHCAVLSA